MNREATSMIFKGPNQPFDENKTTVPPLNKGEVLVKITYSTICTSDLHTFYGRRTSKSPSVLGHEIVGKILAVHSLELKDFNGKALKKGDKITWSVYAFNSEGEMAKKGIPQKDKSLFKYGHEEISPENPLSGGFATHCILKNGTAIFKIPQDLPIKVAGPINCTHATIAGAYRLAGNVKGKNILVIGTGMLGLSACAMGRFYGAKNIVAADVKDSRLEVAKKFGANQICNVKSDHAQVNQQIQNLGGIDTVIETSGSPDAIELGISLSNIGAINIWVGAVYTQRPVKIAAESVVRRLLTIRGLHNYIPDDLSEAIQFIQQTFDTYPFHQLIGKEYPLKDLGKAFEEAQQGHHFRIGIY